MARDAGTANARHAADERKRVRVARAAADKGDAIPHGDDRSTARDIAEAVYRVMFIRTEGRMTPAMLDDMPLDLVLDAADTYLTPPPKP